MKTLKMYTAVKPQTVLVSKTAEHGATVPSEANQEISDPRLPSPFLRLEEVARLLSVTKKHVANLIDSGSLRAVDVRDGGPRSRKCLRIPQEQMTTFLAARGWVGTKPPGAKACAR